MSTYAAIMLRPVLVMALLLGLVQGYWDRSYDSLDLSDKFERLRRNADGNDSLPAGAVTEEATHGPGNEENHNSHGHGGSDGIASHDKGTEHKEHHSVHVASWKYQYVRPYFAICIFFITVCVLKLGFNHASFLSNYIPESCMLILYGACVGALLRACNISPVLAKLEPNHFFLIILPPIILESSYTLHDRTFVDNIGTIIFFAVLGTLASCFLIGPLLYVVGQVNLLGGLELSGTECFVFASLIVAVDPVAVLAIFQEVGVEDRLYFLVFGESLFNDAITVVLYNMMTAFYFMENIPGSQIGKGFASFFTVSLGGLLIGLSFGVLTAIFTKYTRRIKVIEPLAVLILAYSSYLCAELFHLSGIISMIGCGLIQAQYAFHNIGYKSEVTVKNFIKMMSMTMDSLIFLLLGMSMVIARLVWNAAFIAWAIFLCFVVRFTVILGLTFIANKTFRFKEISLEEQFIMAYGGLRGAVAFCLVNMMDSATFDKRDLFETATLMVIVFTVFVQGTTIKPLVSLLHMTKPEDDDANVNLLRFIQRNVNDHILAGIEEISGNGGRNALMEKLHYYDNKYFKRWLQRDPQAKDEVLLDHHQDLEMSIHYESLQAAAKGESCPVYGSEPMPEDTSLSFDDLLQEVQRRLNTMQQAAKVAPITAQTHKRWQRVLRIFKRMENAQSQEDDMKNFNKFMAPAKRYHRSDEDANDDWLRMIEKHRRQRRQRRFRSSLTPQDVTWRPQPSQRARKCLPEVKPLMRGSPVHRAPQHSKSEIELVQQEHNENYDRGEGNNRTLPV